MLSATIGQTIDRKEKARKRIVLLVFAVYLLLIFEGALRKWVFLGGNRYLFFMRDPFVLWIYLIAFRNGLWPKREGLYRLASSVIAIGIVWLLCQFLLNNIPTIVLLFGFRMWFLYIPLAFIIAENFKGEDLRRLVKLTLWIAIPMGILVFKQVRSPVTAFINKSVEEGVFYTETGPRGGGTIRVLGTFTFFHGYQMYISSVVAFLLSAWILKKPARPVSALVLATASAACIVSFAVDFTRLPTMIGGFIFAVSFYTSYFLRDPALKKRARYFIVLILIIGTFAIGRYFSKYQEIRLQRFEGKQDYLEDRTSGMATDFTKIALKVPIFGGGLGSTSRGGQALGAGRVAGASENEWRNMVAEAGPLFGLFYMYFRLFLVFSILKQAQEAVRRSNNPLPLLLWAFLAPVLAIWYMTCKGTVHGYGWLFTGFALAACRLGENGPWSNVETVPDVRHEPAALGVKKIYDIRKKI